MEVGEEAGLKIQSTPKLREFFRAVAAATTVSEKSRAIALNYAEDESVVVPFVFLRDVYEELGPRDRSPIHQVLAGSSIVLESPKPREKIRSSTTSWCTISQSTLKSWSTFPPTRISWVSVEYPLLHC